MYLVRTDAIVPGMKLGRNVTAAEGRVLLTAGTILRDSFLEPLRRHGVAAVYVINELAPDVQPVDVIPDQERQALAAELATVTSAVSQAFDDSARRGLSKFNVGLDLERLERMVGRAVDSLMRNPRVVYNLQDIRTADDYTLSHSVNVCILSVLLGTVMGYRAAELKDLAVGAVLHDVGKIAVPPEILQKPGALTPEEYGVMKSHTYVGWQILRGQNLRPRAAIMALQHHERWEGGGYPKGIRRDEIYRFARICAVVDVFDAMTADRVYRPGMSPARALGVMQTEMPGFFEPGMLYSFLQCVAPYPVGSLVEVSGGRQAVVVDVPRGKTFFPTVRVIMEADGSLLREPYELNLQERPELKINRIIRAEWTGPATPIDDISIPTG